MGTESRSIAEIAEVTDFVANGSFASLKENVTYRREPDYALLLRLTDFRSNWTGEQVYVDEPTFRFLKKSYVTPGDIIIANVGAYAGTVFRAPNLHLPMTLGPNAVLLRVTEPHRTGFIYYLLSSPYGQALIRSIVSGSAQPKFNKTDLRELQLPLPDPAIQVKVESLLSQYDELIENNLRRIEILKEMAQTIYREWFVNFRFPGHEDIQGVEYNTGSTPDGWRATEFGDIASEIRDGVHPSEVDPGSPYVGLEHIPRRSILLSDWGQPSDVSSRKWKYSEGDILFGKLRPYFHKVVRAPSEGICSTDTIVIRPNDGFAEFALLTASSEEFVGHATSTAGGTDRPRANWSDLASYPILLPSRGILERFAEQVRPLVHLMLNLADQNRSLRATRDLLLPKLISGEIDVSELDIDTSWLAA